MRAWTLMLVACFLSGCLDVAPDESGMALDGGDEQNANASGNGEGCPVLEVLDSEGWVAGAAGETAYGDAEGAFVVHLDATVTMSVAPSNMLASFGFSVQDGSGNVVLTVPAEAAADVVRATHDFAPGHYTVIVEPMYSAAMNWILLVEDVVYHQTPDCNA